jgi:hypothetical protein
LEDVGRDDWSTDSLDLPNKSEYGVLQFLSVKLSVSAAGASERDREPAVAVLEVYGRADVATVLSPLVAQRRVAVVRTGCHDDNVLERRKAAGRHVVEGSDELGDGGVLDLLNAVFLDEFPTLLTELTVDEQVAHHGIHHAVANKDLVGEDVGDDVIPQLTGQACNPVDWSSGSGSSRRSSRRGRCFLDC